MSIPTRARLVVSKMLRQFDTEAYDEAVYGGPEEPPVPPEPAAIADLVPNTAVLGSPSFTLHVMGGIFAPESVIVWNGGDEPTICVSDTELTTGVNMETAINPGELPVQVRSPDGTLSAPVTFTFTEAPPAPATASKRRRLFGG